MKYKYGILLISLLFHSCSKNKTSRVSDENPAGKGRQGTEMNLHVDTTSIFLNASDLLEIDLNQSLDGKSLEELRILKNSLYAKQGYLFMKADLRAYFSQTKWYGPLMEKRYWAEEEGRTVEPISFSGEEKKFIAKIDALIEEKQAENYFLRGGRKLANVNNIINKFQFKNMNGDFLEALARDGFLIAPNDNIQFFHLYEQNDYQQVPNFVTTDMYLQLYHMYFSYCLRNAEREFFYRRMAGVSQYMAEQSVKEMSQVTSAELKKAAEFNAIFFGVACKIFGVTFKPGEPEISRQINEETERVMQARDAYSPFLGYNEIKFPYSLFKPRGHYTRSDTLKSYFRAMMWLQKAEMCLENPQGFNNAIYMAHLISSSNSIYRQFKSVFEPVKYIIGEPDNISVLDIASQLKKFGIAKPDMFEHSHKEKMRKNLLSLNRNRIRPKSHVSCVDKVNLMPQRYLFDNEILQELVDTESKITKRAYPRGIDVFGVMDVDQAEDLLFQYYKEEDNWDAFRGKYDRLKKAHSDVENKEKTVYNQWMDCLRVMQRTKDEYPYFMHTEGWQKKNLNTALASWAELKHDAILYAEQPMAAECGDGGPPEPITVGYVEPNVAFWEKMIHLIELTRKVFEDHAILVGGVKKNTGELLESARFLLQASKKELNGEKLSDQEYQTIEYIGSSVEYMTIGLLDNWVDNWNDVKGPDKKVAVVADVYTSNADNNPKQGVMHVATGYVNDLYVVVEIEGYLYLTKGAVFSYYEFVEPMGSRLTDEAWQERLEKKNAPPIPEWMKDIIYDKNPPEPNESIFYSSGC